MTWGARWKLPFASRTGRTFEVRILERGYSSTSTQLTGTPSPFVTQETDNKDLFIPVRRRTAKINIVTSNNSLLATMMPENNTQRMVQLIETVEQTETTLWQGFLTSQSFQQPWEPGYISITLQAKSIVGVLYDTYMPTEKRSGRYPIYQLITDALITIFGSAADASTYMSGLALIDEAEGRWLSAEFMWSLFFQEEDITNEGSTEMAIVPQSFGYVIENVFSLFGLTLRDNGTWLIGCDMTRLLSQSVTYQLYDLAGLTSGTLSYTSVQSMDIPLNTLLAIRTGTGNVQGWEQGKRSVDVTVDLSDGEIPVRTMPETNTDSSTVYEQRTYKTENGDDVQEGTIHMQFHAPRTGATSFEEFFYFRWDYHNNYNTGWEDCSSGSPMNSTQEYPSNDPYVQPGASSKATTGCVPVRWAWQSVDSTSELVLQSGMMWVLEDLTFNSESGEWGRWLYAMNSVLESAVSDGYLCIDFSYEMCNAPGAQSQYHLHWGLLKNVDITLRLTVTIGGKYWNGTEWTTSEANFTIRIKDGGIVTNKDTSMNVAAESGYFIPIDGQNGNIRVMVWNVFKITNNTSENQRNKPIMMIIKSFDLGIYIPSDITADSRTSNKYYQALNSNFADAKSVSTILGTMNNNRYSRSFLFQNDGETFLTSLAYIKINFTTYNQRPEIHLLNKLAEYYAKTKQWIECKAQIDNINDLFLGRFTHNNKKWMCVEKRNDWSNDSVDVLSIMLN